MHDTIVVRYGEIALKGKNRAEFEKRLVRNIRQCLKSSKAEFKKITRKRGRIFIHTKDECPRLSRVFGITSFSHAKKIRFETEEIIDTITGFLKNKSFKSFRVTSHRADNSVSMGSQQMNAIIGKAIVDRFGKKVSLKDFDVDIGVEVLEGYAYVYIDRRDGPGGLPYGANGSAFALVQDRKSLLAAWLMMRRGLRIIPIAYKGQDISRLERYNYGYRELRLTIVQDISQISRMADKTGVFSLIVGDALQDIVDYKLGMLILRPLVGFDDDEISRRLKDI